MVFDNAKSEYNEEALVKAWLRYAELMKPTAEFPSLYYKETGIVIGETEFLRLTKYNREKSIRDKFELGWSILEAKASERLNLLIEQEDNKLNTAQANALRLWMKKHLGYEQKQDEKLKEEGKPYQLRIDINGKMIGFLIDIGAVKLGKELLDLAVSADGYNPITKQQVSVVQEVKEGLPAHNPKVNNETIMNKLKKGS